MTTSSLKAKDLYQRAVQDYELLYLERANIGWRAATKEDPNFAAAFAMVALNSRDPEEMRTAREQAKALAAKASPGEKLMIQWVAAVEEGKYLEGIMAMNDMIAMFPRDKHMYFLAANWLMGVRGNEQAHHLLHKALEIDPDFAPALNDLAYVHARNREFDEALQAIDHYAALLPKEANPQDSYGEILRLAGRLDASIEHYRAALAIDPHFNTSQAGLADTYAVMGDQERARQEYDKAIQNEPNPANRFDYRMQKAITWVTEKNYTEADREFWRISVEAHGLSYELQEAQALRRMAQYAADDQLALERLVSAEDALTHRQNLSPSDRDEELARVLRVRATRLAHAGKAEDAQATLNRLGELAAGNHSRRVQECWHGAVGESLAARANFKEAIAELEEDEDNPQTLAILAKAYQETGAADKSREAQDRLRGTNLQSLERVLALGGNEIKPSQAKEPVAAN
ncbi:MAG TPA: tetratricopeptide repeat protein [Terriglobales bacterium]|nr:tetratricopeptide repeat protein [Terriglobales bacterium]